MNLAQIIAEINKDVDDTLEKQDVIGWVNRCLDDLTPIARKEAKKVADIAPENAYQLPDDHFETYLILVNGLKYEPVSITNPYQTGYKVWNQVLSLQPALDSGEIELYYYRKLAHVSADTDVPEIDSAFHDLFILYTTAHFQYQDEEAGRQQDAMARYNNRLREFYKFTLQNSFQTQSEQSINPIFTM